MSYAIARLRHPPRRGVVAHERIAYDKKSYIWVAFLFFVVCSAPTLGNCLSSSYPPAGATETYPCRLETELAVYHGEELEGHVNTNSFLTVESFSNFFFLDLDCCGPQLFANMSHLACLTNSYFCHFWPTWLTKLNFIPSSLLAIFSFILLGFPLDSTYG